MEQEPQQSRARRILVVTDVFPPVRTSGAALMKDLAVALERVGASCVVATPDDAIHSAFTLEGEGGIAVLRIRSGRLKDPNLFLRALRESALSWTMWKGYRASPIAAGRVDGIVVYCPSIFFGPFVAWLKRRHRCRAYLVVRDIFPEWAADLGLMRKGPHYWMFKAFARLQYAVSDRIGIEAPSNRKFFSVRAPVEVLENWVDAEGAPPDGEFPALPASGRIAVYAGNMGTAQDMDNLLRLARRLAARPDLHFVFIGAGSERARLQAVAGAERLANVRFLPEMPPDALRALLRKCHVGLLSLDRRLRSNNVPGKLLAYLEAGLPVLASVNPGNDVKQVIDATGAGLAFWNGEDDALVRGLESMLDDEPLRARLALGAARLCRDRFSSGKAVEQILHSLASMAAP
jgi:glycosyltransferase involved in cell wall biosynthesis